MQRKQCGDVGDGVSGLEPGQRVAALPIHGEASAETPFGRGIDHAKDDRVGTAVLEQASPTRVANTMTVNPLAAGLLATQLVGEPITPNLVLGLVAVFAGIWIATSEVRKP